MNEKIETILSDVFADNLVIKCILSSLCKGLEGLASKITIHPVQIKEVLHYQISEYIAKQVKHQNLTPHECNKFLLEKVKIYRQVDLYTIEHDYRILTSKKNKLTILKSSSTMKQGSISHNQKKNYILQDGVPVPFLIELGVMNETGKVFAKKYDKFRQINRFLELVEDILPSLKKDKKLSIIDFGCGKSYLTFAMYHLLHNIHGYDINLIGLDLKQDVIDFCNKTAQKLGYSELTFFVGDISTHHPNGKVDMVVTLHACDTATDAALEKAIRWEADIILCVPCCQHELFKQIKNTDLTPLLTHGILKERFTALVTDAARAQILTIMGYQTQILEFIDMEHTAKNLLIRAIRSPTKSNQTKNMKTYLDFKKTLSIAPFLEKILPLQKFTDVV